ncbi:MAG: DUF4307 domain-containing protein [Actinomycetota bacterium]
MPQQPPPHLADRYGKTPTSWYRQARWAIGVAAMIGVGWVIWAGVHQAKADVRWSTVGFVIEPDGGVRVTWDVGKDPGATALCQLRALDRSKTAVGISDVIVGPEEQHVTRRTDLIRTAAPAVTGVVDSCTLT